MYFLCNFSSLQYRIDLVAPVNTEYNYASFSDIVFHHCLCQI